jgi:SAM-dependent methyltransferase
MSRNLWWVAGVALLAMGAGFGVFQGISRSSPARALRVHPHSAVPVPPSSGQARSTPGLEPEGPFRPLPRDERVVGMVPCSEYARYDALDQAGKLEQDVLPPHLDLKRGQSIADIGVGPGFLIFYYSRLVGPGGRVYATDVDPNAIAFLKLRQARALQRRGESFGNLELVQNTMYDVMLPASSIDWALLNEVHNFVNLSEIEPIPPGFTADEHDALLMAQFMERNRQFTASIRRALRPGGRMVVVEMTREKNPGGRFFKDDIIRFVREFGGFELEGAYVGYGQGNTYTLVFRRT